MYRSPFQKLILSIFARRNLVSLYAPFNTIISLIEVSPNLSWQPFQNCPITITNDHNTITNDLFLIVDGQLLKVFQDRLNTFRHGWPPFRFWKSETAATAPGCTVWSLHAGCRDAVYERSAVRRRLQQESSSSLGPSAFPLVSPPPSSSPRALNKVASLCNIQQDKMHVLH